MARTVSSTMKAALFAQETGEAAVTLVTIDHADLQSPLRLSTDPTQRLTETPLVYGTQSRGNDYLFLPMDVVLPVDRDDAPPRTQIVLENIDRQIIPLIRATSSPPSATIEMVLASDPDTIEIALPDFLVASADYDVQAVTLELVVDLLQSEPFPSGRFGPAGFPGLF